MNMLNIDKSLMNALDIEKKGMYDCAIMFSGGKDSTFLLYLLKEIYKKNILAITIDNGLEYDSFWDSARVITSKMNVPHVVYRPNNEMYNLFYKALMSEYELFDNYRNSNYICEVCTSLMWSCAANYAYRNNIQIVISGLDPHQLKKDIYNDMSPDKLCRINETTFKIGSKKCVEIFRNTRLYKSNGEFREFLESNFLISGDVKTLFPFLYIDYDIFKIKEIVQEKVNWKPYTDTDINEYKTSGCKISPFIPLLEELNIIECKTKEKNVNMSKLQEVFDILF